MAEGEKFPPTDLVAAESAIWLQSEFDMILRVVAEIRKSGLKFQFFSSIV